MRELITTTTPVNNEWDFKKKLKLNCNIATDFDGDQLIG